MNVWAVGFPECAGYRSGCLYWRCFVLSSSCVVALIPASTRTLLDNGLVHDTCRRRFGLIPFDPHDSGDVYPETTPVQGSWQKSCSSQKKLNLFRSDACQAFNRALQLLPGGYEIRYALATAYTRLGDTAEASRQLEIFERFRREALERRRRDIASDVEQQEALRNDVAEQGDGR
jgi:hypothetical protein